MAFITAWVDSSFYNNLLHSSFKNLNIRKNKETAAAVSF
jgi:hypothetical protein